MRHRRMARHSRHRSRSHERRSLCTTMRSVLAPRSRLPLDRRPSRPHRTSMPLHRLQQSRIGARARRASGLCRPSACNPRFRARPSPSQRPFSGPPAPKMRGGGQRSTKLLRPRRPSAHRPHTDRARYPRLRPSRHRRLRPPAWTARRALRIRPPRPRLRPVRGASRRLPTTKHWTSGPARRRRPTRALAIPPLARSVHPLGCNQAPFRHRRRPTRSPASPGP